MKNIFSLLILFIVSLCGYESSFGEKSVFGEMEFVKVKGGCFEMGDTFGDGLSIERPVHEVCVDDYYIGEHEVTQEEWKAVMGRNPSLHKKYGEDCPVEYVTFIDVLEFIEKLNEKTGLDFRLPTEAEWEYAARERGKKKKWSGTNKENELKHYAWFAENSALQAHPVKTRKPNALGLYDMSGNVWEWVSDFYATNYYANSPRDNPKGPEQENARIGQGGAAFLGRGGSWFLPARDVRTTHRRADKRTMRTNTLGLRLAITPWNT